VDFRTDGTDRESERFFVDPELEGVISSGFNVTAH